MSDSIELKVRDYECDLQGIVNNAVYQNYLEHARHEFLLAKNISFSELAEQGIHLVVRRVEIDYVRPLKSNDIFTVKSHVDRSSKVRFYFHQEITRNGETMIKAKIECTSLNLRGRPSPLPQLDALFE